MASNGLSFDDLIPQGGTAAPPPAPVGQFDDLIPNQQPVQQQQAPAKQPFGLMDTFPVRIAKSLWSGFTLPGDVQAGNAAVPQSANMPGGENTDNIDRVTALAGMVPTSAMGTVMKRRPANAVHVEVCCNKCLYAGQKSSRRD